MKYVDEFRSGELVKKASRRIKQIAPSQDTRIMEVCGTHTQSFCRFGIDELLPPNIQLISGPGCPVCVSPQEFIDSAIELSKDEKVIILTFGDMMRIPGTKCSLEEQRAQGADVRTAYSCYDSLKVARDNPKKNVIFLAVGFETTAPTIGLSILSAKKENLKNLYFLSSLKLIPPAMESLVKDKRVNLSGFLCPGHVSTVIGTRPYEFISKKYRIPCCVAGFEPLDILEGIFFIIKQIIEHRPRVSNQYSRVVKRAGNQRALGVIERVFKVSGASWRGLGRIPQSGLAIRKEFSRFDAGREFCGLALPERKAINKAQQKCKCSDILKGLSSPAECPLFLKRCLPQDPVGPCMVSAEGACNAYYRYKRRFKTKRAE